MQAQGAEKLNQKEKCEHNHFQHRMGINTTRGMRDTGSSAGVSLFRQSSPSQLPQGLYQMCLAASHCSTLLE